jgi:hypothetical protein
MRTTVHDPVSGCLPPVGRGAEANLGIFARELLAVVPLKVGVPGHRKTKPEGGTASSTSSSRQGSKTTATMMPSSHKNRVRILAADSARCITHFWRPSDPWRMLAFSRLLQVLRSRFLSVDGTLAGESLADAFMSAYPGSRKRLGRWFMDAPLHDGDKTWVVSKMWGTNTEPVLDRLLALAPTDGYGYEAVSDN